jgi:hypothetical protein
VGAARPGLIAAGAALALALAPAAGGGAPLPQAKRCELFPRSFSTNRRVDKLPVAADSARIVGSIGLDDPVHPDFGSGGIGIPFDVVTRHTKRSHVRFQYSDESDHVGYPIPRGVHIEGGGDRHALLLDRDACRLYELFALRRAGSGWSAGSGATWNLRSKHLRPAGWTSADAAGLPMLPLLARDDEVARGRIDHALRVTVSNTRNAYVYPARHIASDESDPSLPRMGERLRLKASVDISRLPSQARVVARAMQLYGLIVADNGSDWFVTGAPSPHWDNDALHALSTLHGRDFEVVDASSLR